MEQRYGVYKGFVVDSDDPQRLGRVRLSLPIFDEQLWALVATLVAGNGHGSWFVPCPGDEVLVAFEGGDPVEPYVIGSLWSATQPPPETDPARAVIHTRHGAMTVFDDGAGGTQIELQSGAAIRVTPGQVTVTAPGTVTLQAGEVIISAGTIQGSADVSRFGVVECTLLEAGTVVAQTYGGPGTPP
jgi:phage baseplate assembly protein V